MKTETITPRDLVAAIHSAYAGSSACHSQGDGKLSETEILRLLAVRQIIPLSVFAGTEGLTINQAFDDQLSRHAQNALMWGLRGRVEFLTELTDWSFADLVGVPRIGPAAASEIERAMARYGLLLKDGDPALLEKAQASSDDAVTDSGQLATQGTPEEIAEACARSLIEIGNEIIRDGTSLLRFSGQIVFGGSNHTKGCLENYIHEHRQSQCGTVERIVAPWLALVDAQRARRKRSAKNPRKQDAPRPERDGNVFRPTFAKSG